MGCFSHLKTRLLNGSSGISLAASASASACSFRTLTFWPRSAKPFYALNFPLGFDGVAMRIPDHPTLILRMLQHRLKKLATAPPILAASCGTYPHRCGRPSCRCHHGGPLRQGQHLTFKEHGKTRSVYVPQELLPEVRSWLAEHKRLKELLR